MSTAYNKDGVAVAPETGSSYNFCLQIGTRYLLISKHNTHVSGSQKVMDVR